MNRLKRVLTWVVLLTIVGGLGANTVAFAEPAPQTPTETSQSVGGDLAAYFPKDTLLYASLGTSPADFEILNSFLARIEAALPPEALEGMPLRLETFLDLIALQITGEDFNTGMRPWLGDQMALGIYSPDFLFDYDYANDDLLPGLLVVSISDREAAAAFVEMLFTDSSVILTRTDQTDSTLFAVNSYDLSGYIAVYDTVLVATPSLDYLPPAGQPTSPNLTDNTYYTDTLDLLPGSAYDAVLYADTPLLVANAIAAEDEMKPEERLLLNLVLRMIGPMAVGLGVEDGTVLVADVAQPVGNVTGLESLGLAFTPLPVADPAFLGNLPESAALVFQGTSIAQVYENSLGMSQTLVDQILGPELVTDGLGPDALMILNLADVLIANLSGFSYPRDLRPWLQGNYAVFAGPNADFNMNAQVEANNFPIDFGMVFEVEDAGATRNFVKVLARELQLLLRLQGVKGVRINTTEADGVDMLTIDISEARLRVLQLVVAASDDLIVFGTRGAVDSVLFTDSPRFDVEMPELLAQPSMILYAGPPKLLPMVDWLAVDMDPAEVDTLRALLGVIERATISVESTPDGGGVLRATLRFAE